MATFQLFFQSGRVKDLSTPLYYSLNILCVSSSFSRVNTVKFLRNTTDTVQCHMVRIAKNGKLNIHVILYRLEFFAAFYVVLQQFRK